MEQAAKIQAFNERLAKNADKLEQARERLAALEAERKNIEYARMQALIGDYFPILEELQLYAKRVARTADRRHPGGKAGEYIWK